MRAYWILGCALSLSCPLVGCNRAAPVPGTNVALAPVPVVDATAKRPVVTLVHHEASPNGPRIRIRTTVVPLDIRVPKEQVQPFSTELPDLFGTDEACRVLSTDELSTVIDGLESQGNARRLFHQVVDVKDGEQATWATQWHRVADGTVTPVVRDDGTIQVTFVPPKAESISDLNVTPVTEALRENETLVIAGSAHIRGQSTATKTPILSDVPWIGDKLFTSRSIQIHCVKVMYLVSCEKVP